MIHPSRFRVIILLVGLMFLAVLFIAGHCECDGNGQCTWVDDGGGGGCVNFAAPGSGADETCRGGTGGGGGGGPTAVPTAPATATPASIWQTLGGNYAYDSPCTDGLGDPIGTILLMAGANAATASQLAFDRLSDIALTSGYNVIWTSQDKFRDNGGCVTGEITRATNEGWHPCWSDQVCTDARWHTRCIVHAQPSPLGYWASCTPHWDWPADQPPPAPSSCLSTLGFVNHIVPPVYNGSENYSGSGYDAARDWLWWSLIQELGMVDAGQVFFSHLVGAHQCSGVRTFETSKVNVIALPCCSLHLDMDPATPGVQSSLTVSGPQDISVNIVLGDTVKSLGSFTFNLIYDDTRLTPPG